MSHLHGLRESVEGVVTRHSVRQTVDRGLEIWPGISWVVRSQIGIKLSEGAPISQVDHCGGNLRETKSLAYQP
jgi:hypothetical protein